MPPLRSRLLFVAFLYAILGCLVTVDHARAAPTLDRPPCPVTNYDPTVDYFPDKISPVVSEYWTISYARSYKVIRNTLANEAYVLYMCKTPRPNSTASLPIPANASFYSVPVFLTATTNRALPRFLERLALRSNIRYVTQITSLTSPCLQLQALRNFTLATPATGWNASEVDVAFGAIRSEVDMAAPAARRTNGTSGVVISAEFESHPLAALEWIKPIAAFFNKEALSTSTFQKASAMYTCNAQGVRQASGAPAAGGNITAAWIFAQTGGTFLTTEPDYKAAILRDAAAAPVILPTATHENVTLSLLLTSSVLFDDTPGEVLLGDILQAYGIASASAPDRTGSESAKYPMVTKHAMFRWDNRNRLDLAASDFISSHLAMPEYVLLDAITATHSGYLSGSGWKRIWIRNVESGEFTFFSVTSCPNYGDTTSDYSLIYPRPVCPYNTTSINSSPSTTTPASTSSNADASTPTVSRGFIAGIFLGSFLGLLITLGGAAFWWRRMRMMGGAGGYLEKRNIGLFVKISEPPAVPVAKEDEAAMAPRESEVQSGEWVRMEAVSKETGRAA